MLLTYTIAQMQAEVQSNDFAHIAHDLDVCMAELFGMCFQYNDGSGIAAALEIYMKNVCQGCKWDQKPEIRKIFHMDLADLDSLMTDVPGSGLRLNYDIYANVIYGTSALVRDLTLAPSILSIIFQPIQ